MAQAAMATPRGKKARRAAARQSAKEVAHWRAVCGLEDTGRRAKSDVQYVRRHAARSGR